MNTFKYIFTLENYSGAQMQGGGIDLKKLSVWDFFSNASLYLLLNAKKEWILRYKYLRTIMLLLWFYLFNYVFRSSILVGTNF